MPVIATPLPTADLVSLGSVAAQLTGLTTAQAAALPSLISAASRAVQSYCRRDFLATDYTESHGSDGTGRLFLRQRPVNSIASITVGRVSPTTMDPAAYQFDPETGEVVGVAGDSFLSLYEFYSGGGYGYGAGSGGYPGVPFPYGGGFRDITVAYNAGYVVVPEDIQQAVIEVVRSMLYSVGRNPAVQSESWGPHSISYGQVGMGLVVGAAKDLLRPYRGFR
jgi:hypothetical protein